MAGRSLIVYWLFFLWYGVSGMQYLVRSMTGAEEPEDVNWLISSAGFYDDYPMQEVLLPFTLWFFGPYTALFINANGGLHFNRYPPCCAQGDTGCSFMAQYSTHMCDFDSSYDNVLGAFITDLNPEALEYDILYAIESHRVLVRWNGIPVFGDDSPDPFLYDFSVIVNANNILEVRYHSVQPHNPWFAGVRRPLQSDPYATNKAMYNTSVNGTYPEPQIIVSGSSVLYCTFETNFCLATPEVPVDGGVVILHPRGNNGLSCLEAGWLFSCVFHIDGDLYYSTLEFDDIFGFVTCVAPPAADGSVVELTIQQEDAGDLGDVEVYLEEALYLHYTTSAAESPPVCHSTDGPCELVDVICASCEGHGAFCWQDCASVWRGLAQVDTCSVCSGGNTGHEPDSDMNCRGECFGPDLNTTQCHPSYLQAEEYEPVPLDKLRHWLIGYRLVPCSVLLFSGVVFLLLNKYSSLSTSSESYK